MLVKTYRDKTEEFTQRLDEVSEAYYYGKQQKYKKLWFEMLNKWYIENEKRLKNGYKIITN